MDNWSMRHNSPTSSNVFLPNYADLNNVVLPPIRPLLQRNQDTGLRSHLDTLRDVESAFHNADIALRNAREALRGDRIMSNRMASNSTMNNSRSANNSRNRGGNDHTDDNVVDLTSLSSDTSNEEPQIQRSQPRHPDESNSTPFVVARHWFVRSHPLGPGFGRDLSYLPPIHTPAHDENAIRRQRQARRSWERVERRNRERAAEQAQRDANDQARRLAEQVTINHDIEEGHGETNTSAVQRTRHSSVESLSSSASHNSDASFASEDTDPTTNQNTQETLNTNITTDSAAMPDSQSQSQSQSQSIQDKSTMEDLLSLQQQSAIQSQKLSSKDTISLDPHSTPLSTYRCAICMDTPTTATTTICGHLFCHTCLKDSLKWSAQQRRDEAGLHGRRLPHAGSGLCPVCRKVLNDSEGSSKAGIVGLEIRSISRKDFERKQKQKKVDEDRESFLKGLDELNSNIDLSSRAGVDKGKAKQKGKSRDREEDDGQDLVKIENFNDDVGIARSRKRRRDEGREYDNTEGF